MAEEFAKSLHYIYSNRGKMRAMNAGRSISRKASSSSRNRNNNHEDVTHGQHLIHLRERLHKALTLGIRSKDEKTKIWWNTDAEVQGQAIRAISAFVTNLTANICRQPSLQASLNETMIALKGLLQSESEQICSMSAEVAVKLTGLLGGSLLKFGGEELVIPLAQMLSCYKSTTSIASATALNRILEKVKPRSVLNGQSGSVSSGDTVWKALEETDAVDSLVKGLQKYESSEAKSAEYYVEFASLLNTILWWWPKSRYIVGNNRKLRLGLLAHCRSHNASVASTALRASSALALCGEVALKQIEDKDMLWSTIRQCLDDSRPRIVRVEAFRFLQSLARSVSGCNAMAGPHLRHFVEGIIQALVEWRSFPHEKWPPDLEMLVIEACRTANALLRWSGDHHSYFWKMGIEKVLSDLLLSDNSDGQQWSKCGDVYQGQQVDTVIRNFHINKHPIIRPHLWDILGWLAIHCEVNLDSTISVKKESLLRLISFACKMSVRTVYKRGQLHVQQEIGNQSTQEVPDISEREPICRAVLFLVYSPFKYLSSQTQLSLAQALEPFGHEWLQSLLQTIALGACNNGNSVSDDLLMVVSLMSLASFSSLEMYSWTLHKYNGLEILSHAIRFYSDSEVSVSRSNVSSHVVSTTHERICCWNDIQDWEGNNLILFLALWAFAKLVPDSVFAQNVKQHIYVQGSIEKVDCKETETGVSIRQFQKLVADNSLAPGVRWYAAYSMACFGIYGFPNKFGGRMKKAFDNDEMSDLLLILSDGSSLFAHLVILAARCPSLLPSSYLISKQNKGSLGDGLLDQETTEKVQKKVYREVRLSSKLHYPALRNILEFVYTGTVKIDEDNVADVRLLAKRCSLEPLLSLLYKRTPSWGLQVLECNLASALDVNGHPYLDVILQAQEEKHSSKVCSLCGLRTEHVHAHRIVLSSNCDYLQALFRSGMRDSSSQVVQVPVGWEALKKLVYFLYTGEISSCKTGCLWNNKDAEQQLEDLQAYIELSWLAEQWFLEDVPDVCLSVVCKQLKMNFNLCPKIIQKAADYSQWVIVEEAAQCMAPAYSRMRDKGELEELDDKLVDIVRVAHVRLSQDHKA